MRTVVLCALTAAAIASAVPAEAQTSVPFRAAVPSEPKVGGRLYGIVDWQSMTATKSFEAVLDSRKNMLTFGGVGYEVTRIWKGVFARATATYSVNDGSRVFIDSAGNAVPLNIPIKIKILPMEVGGGWRFETSGSQRKTVTVVPYIGAAVLIQKYEETSTFADPAENIKTTDIGQAYFGGVELGIAHFKVGVEGQYRNVPDVLGTAGSVSAAYNETNLGGKVFRFIIGIGF